MADDKFKYTFTKRFDVPEAVRVRAQQWLNLGGNPAGIDRAIEGLGDIELTDKQVESLYNSLDDAGKKAMDRRQEFLNQRKPGSRMEKLGKQQYKRALLAQALDTEWHEAGGKYIHTRPEFKSGLNPRDIWGDEKRPKGNINEARKRLRESTDALEKMAEQKAKADRIRNMGMKVIEGGKKGLKFLGPVGIGLSMALDAKDAYALGESTMNPKTEEDLARQRALADLMRRNEIP